MRQGLKAGRPQFPAAVFKFFSRESAPARVLEDAEGQEVRPTAGPEDAADAEGPAEMA